MSLIWSVFVSMHIILVTSQTKCPANTIQDYCYLVDPTPLSPCTAHETCAIRAHQIGWRGQIVGTQYSILSKLPDGLYYTSINRQMGDAIGWKGLYDPSSDIRIMDTDLDQLDMSFGYAMAKVYNGSITVVAARVEQPMEAMAICILSPTEQGPVSQFRASPDAILTADVEFFSCKNEFGNVSTQINCAMRCQKTEYCISFYYKFESHQCVVQLYVDAMLQSDDLPYMWSHMKRVN